MFICVNQWLKPPYQPLTAKARGDAIDTNYTDFIFSLYSCQLWHILAQMESVLPQLAGHVRLRKRDRLVRHRDIRDRTERADDPVSVEPDTSARKSGAFERILPQ